MRSTSNEALLGWLKGINDVQLSPDGRRFVVAGNAREAALYDADCHLVAELPHYGSVWCAAFHPGGDLLATGSDDMGVRVWTRDGELVGLLKGHLNGVYGVAWSASGELLASSSRDGAVRVWAVSNGDAVERWSATGLASRPHVAAWCGNVLVIGAEEEVVLFGPDGAERARVDTGFVRSLHVSDDHRFIAAAHHEWDERDRIDTVTAWTAELDELWSGSGTACGFGDGGVFAVAADDTLCVRSLPDGVELWSVRCHGAAILSLASRADGAWVTGGNDALAIALAPGGDVRGVVRHDQAVTFCRAVGPAVLSATSAGGAALWTDADLEPAPAPAPVREPVARFELGESINSASFSPNGDRFAISAGCFVEVRDTDDGSVLWRAECDEETWAVAWDDELVSARLQDSYARRVWAAASGEHVGDIDDAFDITAAPGGLVVAGGDLVRVFRVSLAPAGIETLYALEADEYGTAVSPSGQLVFLAGPAGQLLDTRSGTTREIGGGNARKAAFSPDERRLIVASESGVVVCWLDGSREPRRLDVRAAVWQLAWSPDGERFAIGTSEEQTSLYRGDGTHIATVGERRSGAVNPIFSPDGSVLATGGSFGPAALWRAADASPIAELGGLATSHIKVMPVAGGRRWLTHANVSPAGDLMLRLWSDTGEPVASLPGHAGEDWWRVAVSPCTNWIVSIVWGDRPRVWSASDGSLWGALDGHGENVRAGELSPLRAGGRVRLVTGGEGCVLSLWDVGPDES